MQAKPDQYPDFHFLLISPNLGAEWLFDAARVYWDRYRPTIVSDFNFVLLIPHEHTVAVTLIARRDTAAQFGVELAQINPDAYFDPVVNDLFDDTKQLTRRARPLGAALRRAADPTNADRSTRTRSSSPRPA